MAQIEQFPAGSTLLWGLINNFYLKSDNEKTQLFDD
jgi:hypothetical protein